VDDVVEAQALHLRPVVEPLEEFLIAFIDELFVSSFRHIYSMGNKKNTQKKKKRPAHRVVGGGLFAITDKHSL